MPTINPQLEEIKLEIEKNLETLAEEKGEPFVARIRPILSANLDRGRVAGFIGNDIQRVAEYVKRVADHYARLNPFINQVQIERTDEVWKPLFKSLRDWAYHFLIRKNFKENQSTQEIAMECATLAAISMLNAYFPYDTEFEPWAHVTAQNGCRKFFQSETKKSIVPQKSIVELDDALSNLDDSILVGQKRQEDRSELFKAIAQLSKARQQVVELHYFDGLSLPEIAEVTGKSLGAIHSSHFNALLELRKILATNRDNT